MHYFILDQRRFVDLVFRILRSGGRAVCQYTLHSQECNATSEPTTGNWYLSMSAGSISTSAEPTVSFVGGIRFSLCQCKSSIQNGCKPVLARSCESRAYFLNMYRVGSLPSPIGKPAKLLFLSFLLAEKVKQLVSQLQAISAFTY